MATLSVTSDIVEAGCVSSTDQTRSHLRPDTRYLHPAGILLLKVQVVIVDFEAKRAAWFGSLHEARNCNFRAREGKLVYFYSHLINEGSYLPCTSIFRVYRKG